MTGVAAQVRTSIIHQCVEHAQSGLLVPCAIAAAGRNHPREPQQPLRSDGGRGAVDRLVLVERIGRARSPVAERREPRCAGIPIRNAVCRAA